MEISLKLIAPVLIASCAICNTYAQKSSLLHDNLKRTFKYHFPSTPGRAASLPLVIVLHGRGGNGESMIRLTRNRFNTLADRDGFIVVYPDGIELNWNDGRMDEEANDKAHRDNIDDVGFISDLIDLFIRDQNADPERIYITGISNGAIMSYRLACELTGKITAIAPVDGNIPVRIFPDCSPSGPISVLAINNTNDPLVPYNGGYIFGSFHRINLGKVLSVDESIRFWVNNNRCSPLPVVTREPDLDKNDGTIVTSSRYKNGINGTEVVLYSIEGGGHTWPGGVQYLPAFIIGKTCRDFDASEVIWEFFRMHSKQVHD
jgi:polyhydroxybutyrate depolymerase